jgi:hypothetical protein
MKICSYNTGNQTDEVLFRAQMMDGMVCLVLSLNVAEYTVRPELFMKQSAISHRKVFRKAVTIN